MFDHRSEQHPLNSRNARHETPLAVACTHGNLEAVRWLVDHGANPELPTKGEVPIQTAERWGHLQIFEYLVQKGGYSKERLSKLFRDCKNPQALQILRENAVRVRNRSSSSIFCLEWAD